MAEDIPLTVAPGNEKGKVIAGRVLFSFGYAGIDGAAPVARQDRNQAKQATVGPIVGSAGWGR
jgi:hypothetical protein